MTRDELVRHIKYELSGELSGKALNKCLRSIPEIRSYGYEFGLSDSCFKREPIYKVYIDFKEPYHKPDMLFFHKTGRYNGYYQFTDEKSHDLVIDVFRKVTDRTFDRWY